MTDIARLNQMIKKSGNIVFFGGAGVSTESGIPDFRSQDGLYSLQYKYPPETMISRTFFDLHPEEFYRFYRERMLYPQARPGAAHLYLVRLENEGKLKAVVTQNIDGLHQAAGSKRVFELHGSVHRNYCMRCGKFYGADYILNGVGVPKCSCGGIVKPDVVLYEEGLEDKTVNGAVAAIAAAELLIVGGTSLVVYPAAGFLRFFKGNDLVVINKSPTPADSGASLVINAPIGEVFSALDMQE